MMKMTSSDERKVNVTVGKNYSIQFEKIPAKIAGLVIHKDEMASILMATAMLFEDEKIKKIAKEHSIDMLFLVSPISFKKMLKCTQENEIEVEMFTTKNREIMLYTTYGVDPAVLFITLIK